MSGPATILVTLGGAVLIAAALRDLFDTLFHPSGRSLLSRAVMRAIWRTFKPIVKVRPRSISLAGPLMVIAIVACWATALILGWALIFWPHIDDGFAATAGRQGSFTDSVYISLVTLATLGYGDFTPSATWLRILAPFEAFLGFGLLTASISWLGSIYPAVQRRRALAYEIYLLRKAQNEAGIGVADLDPGSAAAVYGDLISRIVTAERDLVTFPISYYFAQNDDRFLAVGGDAVRVGSGRTGLGAARRRERTPAGGDAARRDRRLRRHGGRVLPRRPDRGDGPAARRVRARPPARARAAVSQGLAVRHRAGGTACGSVSALTNASSCFVVQHSKTPSQ